IRRLLGACLDRRSEQALARNTQCINLNPGRVDRFLMRHEPDLCGDRADLAAICTDSEHLVQGLRSKDAVIVNHGDPTSFRVLECQRDTAREAEVASGFEDDNARTLPAKSVRILLGESIYDDQELCPPLDAQERIVHRVETLV